MYEVPFLSLIFLYCSGNGSVCHVCCVPDNVYECLVRQFAIFLSVVVILLLNIMEV